MGNDNRHARRAQATRDRVLQAAQHQLEGSGIAGFSLDRVAHDADVAVQTVYNHFQSRDGLLLAVADQALAQDRRYMDAAYDLAAPADQRLLTAARAYIAFGLDQPQAFRLLADPPEISNNNKPLPASVAGVLDRLAALVEDQNQRLEAALRDGIAEGIINPSIDVEQAATALWAMLNGIVALSWRVDRLGRSRSEVEAIAETAFAIVAGGLRARTDAAG